MIMLSLIRRFLVKTCFWCKKIRAGSLEPDFLQIFTLLYRNLKLLGVLLKDPINTFYNLFSKNNGTVWGLSLCPCLLSHCSCELTFINSISWSNIFWVNKHPAIRSKKYPLDSKGTPHSAMR